MVTKAAQLSAFLADKKTFSVTVEIPNFQGSIDITTIENPNGISVTAQGENIIFNDGNRGVSFPMLETAQVFTHIVKGVTITVTLAVNGGLQIKSR